ncbi:MAG TPA: CD225/dispanin family protein [Glycomyces sp.]|nr:CD225/dispanin family protein [Glycomyces sp.]
MADRTPNPPGAAPSNHLALALVSLLLCTVLGTVALVYAAQVAAEWRMGNTWIAEEYSRKARGWAVWGIALGLVVVGIVGLVILAEL